MQIIKFIFSNRNSSQQSVGKITCLKANGAELVKIPFLRNMKVNYRIH
jgi:hypothetical protein